MSNSPKTISPEEMSRLLGDARECVYEAAQVLKEFRYSRSTSNEVLAKLILDAAADTKERLRAQRAASDN